MTPSDEQCKAHVRKLAERLKEPGSSEDVGFFEDLLESVVATRTEFESAQLAVRASVEDELLDQAIAERDAARQAHIESLAAALDAHEKRGAVALLERLRREAADLQEEEVLEGTALGKALTKRVRLDTLTAKLLPGLEQWLDQIEPMQEEHSNLVDHLKRPSTDELRALHEAWKKPPMISKPSSCYRSKRQGAEQTRLR